MRSRLFVFIVGAASALTASAASTEAWDCRCGSHGGPRVVYGTGQSPILLPPVGHVLDPADARPPIYIVNQGTTYSGPNVYARPTYSEGGYAYALPYPYIGPYGRHASPYRGFYGPYGAYGNRVAPSARVISLPVHRFASSRYGVRVGPRAVWPRHKVRGKWHWTR